MIRCRHNRDSSLCPTCSYVPVLDPIDRGHGHGEPIYDPLHGARIESVLGEKRRHIELQPMTQHKWATRG